MDQHEFYRRLRELGPGMERSHVEAAAALCRQLPREAEPPLRTALDQAYGPDPRHRLDVYASADQGEPRPVFLFVHGGGFVGGDKRSADGYAYANLGQWAVAHGMVGVAMTYRLAPAHAWPSAADDVKQAVEWVRRHIAGYGGDPARIVLCGHSAGAAHVAGYLARAETAGEAPGVEKVVLMSGPYDIPAAAGRPNVRAYYGEDHADHAARSTVDTLARLALPLLLVAAELDPPIFQSEALKVVNRYYAANGRLPGFLVALGHNHFSESYHLGSTDTRLGDALAAFAHRR